MSDPFSDEYSDPNFIAADMDEQAGWLDYQLRGAISERDAARSLAMTLEEQLAVAEGLIARLRPVKTPLIGDWVLARTMVTPNVSDCESDLLAKLAEEPSE